MGSAAMAALPYILIGLLIVGVAVSAYFILNYLMLKYFKMDIGEALSAGAAIQHEQFKEDAANFKFLDPSTWGAALNMISEGQKGSGGAIGYAAITTMEGKDKILTQREQDALLMQEDGM